MCKSQIVINACMGIPQ